MTDSPAPRAARGAPGPATEPEPAASRPADGRRPLMLGSGLALLAIATAFAVVVAREPAHSPGPGLDQAWLTVLRQSRATALTEVAKVLSILGGPIGGTVLVGLLTAAFLLLRRPWTALFLALTEACGSAASQLIKHLVLRHRPPHPLVTADIGSFPSGHVITTVAVGLALTAVLTRPGQRARALALVAAAAIVMIWCRTYLGAHWLTDTFESLAVAAGITLVLWWAFTPALAREAGPLARARRPPRAMAAPRAMPGDAGHDGSPESARPGPG